MISKEEVLKIAKLARLELSETEVEKMQKDLSSVLDYFEVLEKAPKPGAGLYLVKSKSENKKEGIDNVLRKDEALRRPASLANNLIGQAPDRKDDYIKVKAIL